MKPSLSNGQWRLYRSLNAVTALRSASAFLTARTRIASSFTVPLKHWATPLACGSTPTCSQACVYRQYRTNCRLRNLLLLF